MCILKRAGSVAGTIVRVLLVCAFLYLIVSAWYFALQNLNITGNTSVTTTSDDFSLAQLAALSFDNANTSLDLLSAQFWNTVLITSGQTIDELIPNTVYGFIQSSNDWREFVQSNMDNPPRWLPSGPLGYDFGMLQSLSLRAIGAGNATAAAEVMDNFTEYAAGLSLAGVDFVTFNGASALRTYLQTGSVFEAGLTTFPGQIYDLFSKAADQSYPEQFRAQFLGEALAITSITIVTAGHDGFDLKFESMLSRLSLLDAWPKFKAYLMDIGMASSPEEAYETTAILQNLADKFPTASVDDLAFTAERIDFMVKSLKDDGFTADEIQEKVAGLAQAAGGSTDVGDVAEAADEADYGATGTIMVVLGDDRVMSLYDEGAQSHNIGVKFLQDEVPGFVPNEAQAFKITIHQGTELLSSYHVYNGGNTFGPAIPEEQGSPGDVVSVSFELLSEDSFVESIPSFELTNQGNTPWVANQVVAEDFSVVGDTFTMNVVQDSPYVNVGGFSVTGIVDNYPGSSLQYGGVFLQFRVTDYLGRTTEMRLQFDGFSSPNLQILKSSTVSRVSMVSYDGFRLSVVYASKYKLATIYVKPPSSDIYALGGMNAYSGEYLTQVTGKYSAAYQIDNVVMLRELENNMLEHGSAYDYGRLGAEIAYVVADEKLGLKDVVIQEPSANGRDLYTQDDTVAIQARLLVNINPAERNSVIQSALLGLVKKVQQDYANQKQMTNGYAVLSYVDGDGSVKTLVLEVPKT